MVKIINESENKFEELFRIQHRGIKEMEKRSQEIRLTEWGESAIGVPKQENYGEWGGE